MTPVDLTVRCMARREGDVWVAVCLDFALAAQGKTLQLARKRLHEQILMYVSEAVSVDAVHASELLARKAPLRDRLAYEICKLKARVKRSVRARFMAYKEALPLLPAAA